MTFSLLKILVRTMFSMIFRSLPILIAVYIIPVTMATTEVRIIEILSNKAQYKDQNNVFEYTFANNLFTKMCQTKLNLVPHVLKS